MIKMTIAKLTKELFGTELNSEAKLIDVFGIPGADISHSEFVEIVELAKIIANARTGPHRHRVYYQRWGETTTEQALVKILTQKAIEKGSNMLTTGLEIVYTEKIDDLEAKFATHERGTAQYPVPDGAQAGRQTIQWNKWGLELEMCEFEYMISDFARIRGERLIQQRTGLREAARAIAEQKRNNIIDTVFAGALGTAAKTAVWTGTSADVMLDISTAYGYILANAVDVPLPKINRGIYCVYPAILAGNIKDYRDASAPNNSHQNMVTQAFNIKWVPTRHYHDSSAIGVQDDALLCINDPMVAQHGQLATGIVPLVESERERGRGQVWTIRDFFGTKVTPSAWSDPSTVSVATNPGIYTITDVL